MDIDTDIKKNPNKTLRNNHNNPKCTPSSLKKTNQPTKQKMKKEGKE